MKRLFAVANQALRSAHWVGAILLCIVVAGCQSRTPLYHWSSANHYGSYSVTGPPPPASALKPYRKVVCEYPDGRRDIRVAVMCGKYGRIVRDVSPEDTAGGSDESPWVGDSRPRKVALTGTGFAVSRYGDYLTNAHVVDGCSSVWVTTPTKISAFAEVIEVSEEVDLAIVSTGLEQDVVATFRAGEPVRPGESVSVVGFSLGSSPALKANLTRGTVRDNAGDRTDNRFVHIAGPAQLATSGGPVLDNSGRVVAVSANRLNAPTIASVAMDVPQDASLALKGHVARLFLETFGIPVATSKDAPKLDETTMTLLAAQLLVVVECWK